MTTMTTMHLQPLRGVFVGSGSDGMSDPRIAELIVGMVNLQPSSTTVRRPIQVLYVGTATYDLPCFAQRQTQWFTATTGCSSGGVGTNVECQVSSLELVHQSPTEDEIRTRIDMADIILVGGGNTLYAVDRWKRLNIVPMLQSAVERGVIVAGGSAGAICWFDGGHSDSMDPDTYYGPMMQKFGSTKMGTDSMTTRMTLEVDESTTICSNNNCTEGVGKLAGTTASNKDKTKDWKYIRVPGLGFLPGLVCPHHDRIQSNGVLRADDFDEMLLHHHPDEVGLGIDHWAALVVDRAQDVYRVVSLEGKPGSVVYHDSNKNSGGSAGDDADENGIISACGFSASGKGVPGVWLKQVKEGKVVATVLPSSGKLSDILQPARSISEDYDALAQCRHENPDILLVDGL